MTSSTSPNKELGAQPASEILRIAPAGMTVRLDRMVGEQLGTLV
jgi:hypothetical protein